MQIASSKATPILEHPEKNDRSHNASIEMERPGIVETFGGKNFYEEKRQNPKDLNKERFKALQKLWIAVTKYIEPLAKISKSRRGEREAVRSFAGWPDGKETVISGMLRVSADRRRPRSPLARWQ